MTDTEGLAVHREWRERAVEVKEKAVIDAHVHSHFRVEGRKEASIAVVVRYMHEYGIDRCVLLSLENDDQAEYTDKDGDRSLILNSTTLRAYLNHPEKFLPFFTVDPRDTGIEQKMEQYAELGFRGFGEHKVMNLPFNSPGCERIYMMCKHLNLPVLFHIGRGGFPETDMAAVEQMIRKYEEVVFIAHSMGWWKQISKDWSVSENYPMGKVIPGGAVGRMLSTYPNLYADISAPEGIGALARDPDFTSRFLEEHAQKLMYGTDFPCEAVWPEVYVEQIAWRRKLLFGEETPSDMWQGYAAVAEILHSDNVLYDNITHNNVARILGLSTISH